MQHQTVWKRGWGNRITSVVFFCHILADVFCVGMDDLCCHMCVSDAFINSSFIPWHFYRARSIVLFHQIESSILLIDSTGLAATSVSTDRNSIEETDRVFSVVKYYTTTTVENPWVSPHVLLLTVIADNNKLRVTRTYGNWKKWSYANIRLSWCRHCEVRLSVGKSISTFETRQLEANGAVLSGVFAVLCTHTQCVCILTQDAVYSIIATCRSFSWKRPVINYSTRNTSCNLSARADNGLDTLTPLSVY